MLCTCAGKEVGGHTKNAHIQLRKIDKKDTGGGLLYCYAAMLLCFYAAMLARTRVVHSYAAMQRCKHPAMQHCKHTTLYKHPRYATAHLLRRWSKLALGSKAIMVSLPSAASTLTACVHVYIQLACVRVHQRDREIGRHSKN